MEAIAQCEASCKESEAWCIPNSAASRSVLHEQNAETIVPSEAGIPETSLFPTNIVMGTAR